jgi:hypothetical protein
MLQIKKNVTKGIFLSYMANLKNKSLLVFDVHNQWLKTGRMSNDLLTKRYFIVMSLIFV